jgi:hypothetical protein
MMSPLTALLLSSAWIAGMQATPAAQNPPPKVEAFLQRCEQTRRGAILQLEHTLRGLRQQGKSSETTRRIADVQAELRVLEANEKPLVPSLAFPPEAGAIGRLPREVCYLEQVVSDDEMLVRVNFPLRVGVVRNFRAVGEKVFQSVTFFVRGVPTKGLNEGADFALPQVFEVTRRHSYTTVDGARRSVWVLEEFDMRTIEPYLAKNRPAPPAP